MDNFALLDLTLLMRGMVEGSRVVEGFRVVCFGVVGERVGFDERVDFEHG